MRFRVSRLAAALVFGFLLTSSTSALATTRWVNDPPNSYSPPGMSCVSPGYATIGAAVMAAMSGDTIVVGTPFEDSNATGINGDQSNNSASSSGAAYVFVRSGGVLLCSSF